MVHYSKTKLPFHKHLFQVNNKDNEKSPLTMLQLFDFFIDFDNVIFHNFHSV